MRRRLLQLLALLFAITLIAAACGDDDDGGDSGDDGTEEDSGADGEGTDGEGEDGEMPEDDGGEDAEPAEDDVEGSQGDGSLLQVVRDRDMLICGGAEEVPGFAALDADGEYQGFDSDFCRVIAAGVLGDSTKVEFVPLTADQRFTALQSGQVDVLVRNTTWTATRDGAEGVNFLFTTFYDGQGMMVAADSGIEDFAGLEGAAICVQSGTTTELNLASYMDSLGVSYEPLTFSSNDEIQTAYDAGQCQGWTSDASQLAGFKSKIEEGGGAEQTILSEIISKEPLGPLVVDGDAEWAQAVEWSVMATVQAEEFGLDSSNIGSPDLDNPEIERFVGEAVDEETGEGFDAGLGLDPKFAVNVVEQVGNYAEIYDRHIPGIGIERDGTVNDLWTNGGLLYTPPYR